METASSRPRILIQTKSDFISLRMRTLYIYMYTHMSLTGPTQKAVFKGLNKRSSSLGAKKVMTPLPPITPCLHLSLFQITTARGSSSPFIKVGPQVTWSWCTW